MKRPANTTSHRTRTHGLTPQRLIADYHEAHPGRVAAQLATRLPQVDPAADTERIPAVQGPGTDAIPAIVLRVMAPRPAVTQ